MFRSNQPKHRDVKEIKAFIRASCVERVVDSLDRIGVTGVSIIEVEGLGSLADPRGAQYSVQTAERTSRIVKAELVCRDADLHRIIETLRSAAYSGQPGDGIIYASTVEHAVKVRTGAIGEEGLL